MISECDWRQYWQGVILEGAVADANGTFTRPRVATAFLSLHLVCKKDGVEIAPYTLAEATEFIEKHKRENGGLFDQLHVVVGTDANCTLEPNIPNLTGDNVFLKGDENSHRRYPRTIYLQELPDHRPRRQYVGTRRCPGGPLGMV